MSTEFDKKLLKIKGKLCYQKLVDSQKSLFADMILEIN